ncbi:MAG: DUF4397 domain-containing protein [Lunatimonas sp.]|uniref:DUF4397 domain-containing protein n=1 Tax=Lunatimonas sp. TaxID=2060141 RepID=UPI00263A8E7A|nr:DUF4397 domain-containing protein [Lunatimonas sp.]MCC5936291.1 DUF4397 domain-containing protein [Lunatimonas sp.]
MNSSKTLKINGLKVLAWLLLAFGASSCLDEQSVPEATPIAFVSFYHGSPQTDPITITVDNRVYNSNPFGYGNYFEYGNFYTGQRSFSFRNPGASSSLLDTVVTLKASEAYSFFIAEHEDLFEPIIVKDQLENPGQGKALLRLAHLSPDSPEVHLRVGTAVEPVLKDQAFGEVSAYKAIDAGRFALKILDAESGEEELVSANDISILAGRIYTLVLRGYKENTSGTENRLSLQLLRNYPNY